MPELDHNCPHCGAPMESRFFIRICPYCGYCDTIEGKYINQETPVSVYPESLYEYCVKNLSYVQSCCRVQNNRENTEIILTSKGFFAPKHDRHLHPSLRFYYRALVRRSSYDLFLCTNVDEVDNSDLFIKTSSNAIIRPKPVLNNGYWQYSIIAEDLSTLCLSKNLLLDCSFPLMEYVDADELIIYSQRFYNILIDRSKYLYAQNRFILCDKL